MGARVRNSLCFCVTFTVLLDETKDPKLTPTVQRKIIHIDMDAFFASVEQHDRPELRGIPVAVGGGEARGVVCAASYEARRLGVRSAMPGSKARRLCPSLTFVTPRFERYKEVSRRIHYIFRDYTDIIEPLSLDEAFLDVTDNKRGIELARDIAIEIKKRIHSELGLTASAGVSYNKFLAKIASDHNKPNGLCVIPPSIAQQFIDALDIEQFWGVGRITAKRMHQEGIHTGRDLRERGRSELVRLFGKAGYYYYDFAHGIDQRPVEVEWQRKSVGCEYTLTTDCNNWDELVLIIEELASDLERRAIRAEFLGRSLTLKVKYHDFRQLTRSYTPIAPPTTQSEYRDIALHLLGSIDTNTPIRLLGLSLGHPLLEHEGEIWYQPLLFQDDL